MILYLFMERINRHAPNRASCYVSCTVPRLHTYNQANLFLFRLGGILSILAQY